MLVLLNRIKRILLLFFTLFALSFHAVEKPISPALAYDTADGLSFEVTEIVDGNILQADKQLSWKEVTIEVTNNATIQYRYGYAAFASLEFENNFGESAHYNLPAFRNGGQPNYIPKGTSHLKVFIYLRGDIIETYITGVVYLGNNGQPFGLTIDVEIPTTLQPISAVNDVSFNAYCNYVEHDPNTNLKHVEFEIDAVDTTISLKSAYMVASNIYGQEVTVDLPQKDFVGPVVCIGCGDDNTQMGRAIYEAIFTLPEDLSTIRLYGPMFFNGRMMSVDMISHKRIDNDQKDYNLLFQADYADIIDNRIKTLHLSLKNKTVFNIKLDPYEGSKIRFNYNNSPTIEMELGKAIKITKNTTLELLLTPDVPANVSFISFTHLQNDKLSLSNDFENVWANFDEEITVYDTYPKTESDSFNMCGMSGYLQSLNVDDKNFIKSVTFHLISTYKVPAKLTSMCYMVLYDGDTQVSGLSFSIEGSGHPILDVDATYTIEVDSEAPLVSFNRAFVTFAPMIDQIGDKRILLELNLESYTIGEYVDTTPHIVHGGGNYDNNTKTGNNVPLYVIIPISIIGGILVLGGLSFLISFLIKTPKKRR